MSSPSLEATLEDFVWGRVRESEYLERVAKADVDTAEAILSRVQVIDTDLNKKLRKGVEENLVRLLDQTTALEGLERRQRSVHAHMEHVSEGCSRIAASLSSQLDEFREGVAVAQRLQTAKHLLGDAIRCEELMDMFEKRKELVKRSEIICEMRAIVKEQPSLSEIVWLRPTIGDKLKRAQNELQATASNDLRRGLETLNASTVTSAKRALGNLGVLDGELEQWLARSVASLDSSFLQLASAPANASVLLPTAVNAVQAQLEQASQLGDAHLARFCDRLARTVRARVPVDAPYALRLVQSLSRVLHARTASPSLAPLHDALRPLKHALLSQSLARLHEVIGHHDLSATPNSSRFVEVLNTSMEDELRQLEWDSELHADTAKNLGKCFELVAQKIENALRLDEASLLLGDRLSAAQQANYRLLQSAHSLASHWPAHSEPLHRVHTEATTLMVSSVRDAISAILASMHGEKLGGRDQSAFMQELVAYLGSLAMHCAHAPSSLGRSDIGCSLADHTLLCFLAHASLVRPLEDATRRQLRADLDRLLAALDEMGAPLGLASYSARQASDAVLRDLLTSHAGELSYPSFSPGASSSMCVPAWLYAQFLISESPPELLSPHDSVQYTKEQYTKWVLEQADPERLKFLSGLLDAYSTSVVQKGGTSYVPNFSLIVSLLEDWRKAIAVTK